jgi:hypothetical protein
LRRIGVDGTAIAGSRRITLRESSLQDFGINPREVYAPKRAHAMCATEQSAAGIHPILKNARPVEFAFPGAVFDIGISSPVFAMPLAGFAPCRNRRRFLAGCVAVNPAFTGTPAEFWLSVLFPMAAGFCLVDGSPGAVVRRSYGK